MTIRRSLHKSGFQSRVAAQKEILSSAHQEERLAFARSHQSFDWNKVLFTDESCIQIGYHGRLRVWRLCGERYDPSNIQHHKRSGRYTIPIWGCLSSNGLGILHRIDGNLDGLQYRDILESVMFPFSDGNFIFQHDRSPIHESRIAKSWFKDVHPEIEVLDWPRRGADLNPIENVWGLLKRTIVLQGVQNKDQLWEATQVAYHKIINEHPNLARTLINSMPQRVGEVIAREGAWSHY